MPARSGTLAQTNRRLGLRDRVGDSARVRVPSGFVECRGAGVIGACRADLAEVPSATFWGAGERLANARGRGDGVVVLQLRPDLRAVARTYRRGGVLGGVLREHFLDPDRPLREVEALLALRAAGVPTVEPLAALAQRDASFWRLRLVTRLEDGALPLPAFVAQHAHLRALAVTRAGQVVAAAFAAGLRHRDLHPDNLIATAPAGGDALPRVLMLVLDRALVAAPITLAMQLAMLTRMARYLVRHRADLPTQPSRTDALRFLLGMGLDRSRRHAYARAIGARLRRQIALRRWLGPR